MGNTSPVVEHTLQRGVWTPTLGASVADGTHTYNAALRGGRFQRFGSLVFVTGNIGVTSKDAAISGALRIRGLPFIVSSVLGPNSTNIIPQGVIVAVAAGTVTLTTDYTYLNCQAISGTTDLGINQWGSAKALAIVDDTMLGSTPGFRFSISYFTD